jgi:hypothetical protein
MPKRNDDAAHVFVSDRQTMPAGGVGRLRRYRACGGSCRHRCIYRCAHGRTHSSPGTDRDADGYERANCCANSDGHTDARADSHSHTDVGANSDGHTDACADRSTDGYGHA